MRNLFVTLGAALFICGALALAQTPGSTGTGDPIKSDGDKASSDKTLLKEPIKTVSPKDLKKKRNKKPADEPVDDENPTSGPTGKKPVQRPDVETD